MEQAQLDPSSIPTILDLAGGIDFFQLRRGHDVAVWRSDARHLNTQAGRSQDKAVGSIMVVEKQTAVLYNGRS
jgi:hypothetical protein